MTLKEKTEDEQDELLYKTPVLRSLSFTVLVREVHSKEIFYTMSLSNFNELNPNTLRIG